MRNLNNVELLNVAGGFYTYNKNKIGNQRHIPIPLDTPTIDQRHRADMEGYGPVGAGFLLPDEDFATPPLNTQDSHITAEFVETLKNTIDPKALDETGKTVDDIVNELSYLTNESINDATHEILNDWDRMYGDSDVEPEDNAYRNFFKNYDLVNGSEALDGENIVGLKENFYYEMSLSETGVSLEDFKASFNTIIDANYGKGVAQAIIDHVDTVYKHGVNKFLPNEESSVGSETDTLNPANDGLNNHPADHPGNGGGGDVVEGGDVSKPTGLPGGDPKSADETKGTSGKLTNDDGFTDPLINPEEEDTKFLEVALSELPELEIFGEAVALYGLIAAPAFSAAGLYLALEQNADKHAALEHLTETAETLTQFGLLTPDKLDFIEATSNFQYKESNNKIHISDSLETDSDKFIGNIETLLLSLGYERTSNSGAMYTYSQTDKSQNSDALPDLSVEFDTEGSTSLANGGAEPESFNVTIQAVDGDEDSIAAVVAQIMPDSYTQTQIGSIPTASSSMSPDHRGIEALKLAETYATDNNGVFTGYFTDSLQPIYNFDGKWAHIQIGESHIDIGGGFIPILEQEKDTTPVFFVAASIADIELRDPKEVDNRFKWLTGAGLGDVDTFDIPDYSAQGSVASEEEFNRFMLSAGLIPYSASDSEVPGEFFASITRDGIAIYNIQHESGTEYTIRSLGVMSSNHSESSEPEDNFVQTVHSLQNLFSNIHQEQQKYLIEDAKYPFEQYYQFIPEMHDSGEKTLTAQLGNYPSELLGADLMTGPHNLSLEVVESSPNTFDSWSLIDQLSGDTIAASMPSDVASINLYQGNEDYIELDSKDIEVFSERYTLFIEGEDGILYNATSPIGTKIVENLSSNSPVYTQVGNSFVTIENAFFAKANTPTDLYPFG